MNSIDIFRVCTFSFIGSKLNKDRIQMLIKIEYLLIMTYDTCALENKFIIEECKPNKMGDGKKSVTMHGVIKFSKRRMFFMLFKISAVINKFREICSRIHT